MRGSTNAASEPYETFASYSSAWGDTHEVDGFMEYRRIAPKKGVLSGSIKVLANGASDKFYFAPLSNIGAILGVSFKTPSINIATGWYLCIPPDGAIRPDDYGLGAPLIVTYDGNLALGRFYQSSGTYGGWSLDRFSNNNIIFGDVMLEEN